jgi:hypothetical protein
MVSGLLHNYLKGGEIKTEKKTNQDTPLSMQILEVLVALIYLEY